MMVLLVLCLVYFSCVIALPDPTWKVTFERPGDENRHGDYGSSNFHPINPTAAFKPNGFGNEYNSQSHNFHPPAPYKDDAMMMGHWAWPSLYTNPNSFKFNVNHGASHGYFYNHHTPQYNQHPFHDKKPAVPENANFILPFNFGNNMNKRDQYESENSRGPRGYHHYHYDHDHKPLHHENVHSELPSFPHNQYNHENHHNKPTMSANNDIGHPFSGFSNAFDVGEFSQGHHQNHHHNYKPQFNGESQFGFTSFPSNQVYNEKFATTNLDSLYLNDNKPFMNAFLPNFDLNEPRNGFKPVMMNQYRQEEGSLENVDDNEELKRGHSHGNHHSYYHGYDHSHQIYYKPVITEDGDIKFVPVFFRPQIGHYPPFEYFSKPKPHNKDEEDSTESKEKHDGFLENNQEQQKELTLESNGSNDKQDDSITEDELESGEQEE